MSQTKELDITGSSQLKDTQTHGLPDLWVLLCKASSKPQGWMKSTKVMEIGGVGCLIQVTTQYRDNVAEAVTFAPGVRLSDDKTYLRAGLPPKRDT